jgi:hypothetical protein
MINLRVFISSPGDVADERNMARRVLSEDLPRRPAFRGRVTFDPISWDDPAAGVAMIATEQPQLSVSRALPRPSECEIVIVILWSRMGTLLPGAQRKPTGERYASGTEWEYEDAISSPKKPTVLVYRRTEKRRVDLDEPDLDAQRDQLRQVERFFARFSATDGSLSGGFTTYSTPSDFAAKLSQNLEQLVWERLQTADVSPVAQAQRWESSPFPGLRAFTTSDAPIFFGRGSETDALVSRVCAQPFTAVIGGSGSGKSSLVAAGLIPRLRDGGVPEHIRWILPWYEPTAREWTGPRFTPGDTGPDPFLALAVRLAPLTRARAPDIAARLRDEPAAIGTYLGELAAPGPVLTTPLLFIDQFEELFTLCEPACARDFGHFLECCAGRDDLRVVVTLRSDFYQHCVESPPLAKLLKEGSFPLAPPDGALLEMIDGPAQLAGLEFDEGLIGTILRDTSGQPGALALLAYTLDELYRGSPDKHLITRASYQELGGVQGALSRRAEETYQRLGDLDPGAFGRLFTELISVDELGTATRRRTQLAAFAGDLGATQLINAFVADRLLTVGDSSPATLEVAHEAMFQHWPRLAEWIMREQEDLILLRQLRQAAALWDSKGRQEEYFWSGQRLKEARAMTERRRPALSDTEQAFARPEAERLMEIINDPANDHFQRAYVGDRLAIITDTRSGVGVTPDGLPAIVWCPVAGRRLQIAMYPVTYRQFRCFAEAESWTVRQSRRMDNCPAENVSYDDAVAFCKWLSRQICRTVRLPAGVEWEQAARGPHGDYRYPWGLHWIPANANTTESRLLRTVAVGMYPLGRAECGASDMSGNVWEWTSDPGPDEGYHILRGGSWLAAAERASVTAARPERDEKRANNIGFRPVLEGE